MQKFFSLAIFGVVVLLSACNSVDNNTAVAPDSRSNGSITATATTYIVDYIGDADAAENTVTKAGGVVKSGIEELNLLFVTDLTQNELDKLAKNNNVAQIIADVPINYVPSLASVLGGRNQQDAVRQSTPSGVPGDAWFYGIQWNMQVIDIEDAWEVSTGDGVRVGILDTGGSPDHMDLAGKYDIGACMNFTSPDPSDWQDRHFHGTHVAGTIAGNNIGVAPVAPNATLIAVKVLNDDGYGEMEWILNGIMYAASDDGGNCDIINMSLGGTEQRKDMKKMVGLWTRAINWATRQGCLVVCAAGNDGADLDHDKNAMVTPVQAGNAMGVSATGPVGQTDFDQLSCFSNYGTSVISVAAPGGNVDCAYGVVMVEDLVLSTLSPWVAENVLGVPPPYEAWYLFAAGTSMACPHVAGTAALVESAHGNYNPGWVSNKIERSADDLGKPGTDPAYGKGRINANNAVH